jgi:hypothetical protein
MNAYLYLAFRAEPPTTFNEVWFMLAGTASTALVLVCLFVLKKTLNTLDKVVSRVDDLERNAIRHSGQIDVQYNELRLRIKALEKYTESHHHELEKRNN